MAILVAVAIPTVASITGSATDSVQKTNARTIESIIKLAEAEASATLASGEGVATIGATEIDAALTAAKLGIDEGSFVYDSETGICKVGTAASGAKQFLIEFDADNTTAADAIKVTAGQ